MKPNRIIYGKLRIKDTVYPFFMQDQLVTITQTPYEHNNDFSDLTVVEKIVGLTNGNKIVALMNCRFPNHPWRVLCSSITFSVSWFVEYDTEEQSFDKICFKSTALNAFFPTVRAIDGSSFDNQAAADGSYRFSIRPIKDRTRKFVSTIGDDSVTVLLTVAWSISARLEDPQIGQKFTECSFIFDSERNADCLGKYYLWLYDFLVFVTFRQCVDIDEVDLLKNDSSGRNHKIGSAYFFAPYRGFVADARKTITFEDIGEDRVGTLFSNVAMRRNDHRFNPLYIPENDEDARTVDIVKWISAALAFEGEFNANYPNYKYQSDEDFRNAKNKLMETIEEQIKLSGRGKNNKVNSGYKRFRDLIDKADTTLEEKIIFMFDQYATVIDAVQQRYMEANNVEATNRELAFRWAAYRNSIAHGSLEPIKGMDIVNYAITKMFIYVLVLESSGISKEAQQSIIEKMF